MSQEVIYISMVLWLLPLISNFKRSYFYFFIGIAIQDPGSHIFYRLLEFTPNFWVTFCQLFIIYTLKPGKGFLRKKEFGIVVLTITVLLIGIPSNIVVIVLDCIILLKILIILIEEIKNRSNLNLFVVMLAFYVLNLLLNSLFISTLSVNKEVYYLYSFISMFGFAIFFTFTNEKSKFLQVNLNKYLANANDDKNNSSR